MTFPGFRKLLFIVPCFVAVGLAAACCDPAAPCGSPAVYYYEPITDAQGNTRYVMRCVSAPASTAGTTLTAAGGKLHLQGSDGARMTCEKFTILVNGADPVDVAIDGKEVRLTSGKDGKEGDVFQATARSVTRTGPEGATLILKGGAKLVYVRKGKKIDVSTEMVSVNLWTGQVISEMDAPERAQPAPPAIIPGAPPASAVPPVERLTNSRPLRGGGTEPRIDGTAPTPLTPSTMPR